MVKSLLGCYLIGLGIYWGHPSNLGEVWLYFQDAQVQVPIPDDWDQLELRGGVKVNPQNEEIWLFFKTMPELSLANAQKKFKSYLSPYIEDIACHIQNIAENGQATMPHVLLQGQGFVEGEEVSLQILLSQTPNQKVLISIAVAEAPIMEKYSKTLSTIFLNIQPSDN